MNSSSARHQFGRDRWRAWRERPGTFDDVAPQAPVHVLIIPKREIVNLNEVEASDEQLLGHILVVARKVAELKGIAKDGWRLVLNTNAHGGQSVYHLHAHVVGGRQMGWPPG